MNVAKGDIMASINILPYFFTITHQVFQLTYSGNELVFAVRIFLECVKKEIIFAGSLF